MERGLGEYYHSPVVKRKEESIGEKKQYAIYVKSTFLNFALNVTKSFCMKDQLYIRKYFLVK